MRCRALALLVVVAATAVARAEVLGVRFASDRCLDVVDVDVLLADVRVVARTLVVVVHEPLVTLRRSSLTRVPAAGERWEVKFPISPVAGAAVVSFMLSAARAPEGGETLGIIRLYVQKVSQSP